MARLMNYRNLEVYRLAHELAVEIHRMTLSELPKFEQYEEASQIRRSAKSISMKADRAEYFLSKYDFLGRKISRFIDGVEISHRSED